MVLFKGHTARRLPIEVEPIGNLTAPLPHLRVDDHFLVLDSMGKSGSADDGPFDLHVYGGSINVDLSNALIRRTAVEVKYGVVNIDHLRHDYIKVWSDQDDLILQDHRDYELQ